MHDLNEFLLKLAQEKRMSRHAHSIPGPVIAELEQKGWLNRDCEGHLRPGELLIVHLGNDAEAESREN